MKNLHYKLIAFFLAMLFWYVVQSEEVLEINRKLQITIQVPEGFIVKDGSVRFKDVTLSGSRAMLGEFSPRPIEAVIRLKEKKPGKYRFRIDKEFIPGWNNRTKLTVHDAYLHVEVDERLTRTVPVKELIQGIPSEGFMIEKTQIEPSKVTVSGAKTDVKKIKHILTEPIDINGIEKTTELDIALQNLDYAQISEERVKISFQIGEKKSNRRYASIPIEVDGGSKYSYIVKPKYAEIVIQGTPKILDGIHKKDLRVFLDLRDLGVGKYERNVLVKIPSDTVLIETYPEKALIEIVDKLK